MAIDAGTTPMTGERAVARIRSLVPGLVASEARVAEAVLADPAAVVHKTASALGHEAGTSATTVIRFARSVGFPGFQSLALSLGTAAPRLRSAGPALTPGAGIREIAALVARDGADAVGEIPDVIDVAALERSVAALRDADHILVVGQGMTAPIAADGAFRLAHMGLPAEAPLDPHVQRARARALGPLDVCWVVMHGGTLPALVGCARDARAREAVVVALTSHDRTPLTAVADHALVVGADTTRSGVRAWASRLAHLAVVDMVVLALLHGDDPLVGGSGRLTSALDSFADVLEDEA